MLLQVGFPHWAIRSFMVRQVYWVHHPCQVYGRKKDYKGMMYKESPVSNPSCVLLADIRRKNKLSHHQWPRKHLPFCSKVRVVRLQVNLCHDRISAQGQCCSNVTLGLHLWTVGYWVWHPQASSLCFLCHFSGTAKLSCNFLGLVWYTRHFWSCAVLLVGCQDWDTHSMGSAMPNPLVCCLTGGPCGMVQPGWDWHFHHHAQHICTHTSECRYALEVSICKVLLAQNKLVGRS